MKVILDTHTLLWWLLDDPKLSKKARHTIANPENEIFVSSASAWEISTKYRIGKLPEAEDVAKNLTSYLHQARFTSLNITMEHSLVAGSLPGPHRDPFDRMLIAQSKLETLPIITTDAIFKKYKTKVIW